VGCKLIIFLYLKYLRTHASSVKVEDTELLGLLGEDLQDVESDSLGEGSALATDNGVTVLNSESGGAVDGGVLVSLLESVVFLDVMEVISSDDDGSGHLGGNDNTLNDLASDGDVAGEGALLVDVLALNGGGGGLEAQTDVLVVSNTLGRLLGEEILGVQEVTVLLLESVVVLNIRHFWSFCILGLYVREGLCVCVYMLER
jgi:hypothetical protein